MPKTYDEFSKEDLVRWIESCMDFFDDNVTPKKEGVGLYSVYGRLKKYAEIKEAELSALRAERDEAIRLLKELDIANETANGNGYGAWDVNGTTQKRIETMLGNVRQ